MQSRAESLVRWKKERTGGQALLLCSYVILHDHMFLYDYVFLKLGKIRYLTTIYFHSEFPFVRFSLMSDGIGMATGIFRIQLRKAELERGHFNYNLESHFSKTSQK